MGESRDFGLGEIGQIALTVHDLDRAVNFYRDVLQIPFLFQVPNMAFFDCGSTRLMLTLPESKKAKPASSMLYYKVENLEIAYAALCDRGVTVTGEPHLIAKMPDHDLWMAFFQDPDKNAFAIMSEVRPGAA